MQWDIFRHNGEWVGQVTADSQDEALCKAWSQYFGVPRGRARYDGTLAVRPAHKGL